MRKILTTILMVLAMAAVNADVNPMLGLVYEMNEGSNKYIQVRNIAGCENMTMDEIDAAYNEYKAEMKKQAELKAKMAKLRAANPVTNSKAATIVKMVRENPFNLKVNTIPSNIETYVKIANDQKQPESVRSNHEAIARTVFNRSVDNPFPTDYICMSALAPYNNIR